MNEPIRNLSYKTMHKTYPSDGLFGHILIILLDNSIFYINR